VAAWPDRCHSETGVAGEVQDHVDAIGVGLADFRGEIAAVIHDRRGPQVRDQGALVVGGGGGHHVRARLRGQLHGLVADPASGADYQDLVTRLDLDGIESLNGGSGGQPEGT
jgi:hypothetical protein